MSARKSVVMMSDSKENFELIGKPIRADSWYGFTDGMHTVSVTYSDFTGAFGLQGTLSLNPKEEDWFYIDLNHRNMDNDPFIRYPKGPLPTGDLGDTGIDAFTFFGNFTFLRAMLIRNYLQTPPENGLTTGLNLGTVDKVLLSM